MITVGLAGMAFAQEEVVLVGGAYADARRALQPGAPPPEWPAGWRALETCTVLEVCAVLSAQCCPGAVAPGFFISFRCV